MSLLRFWSIIGCCFTFVYAVGIAFVAKIAFVDLERPLVSVSNCRSGDPTSSPLTNPEMLHLSEVIACVLVIIEYGDSFL